jgi:hypothetical protein
MGLEYVSRESKDGFWDIFLVDNEDKIEVFICTVYEKHHVKILEKNLNNYKDNRLRKEEG